MNPHENENRIGIGLGIVLGTRRLNCHHELNNNKKINVFHPRINARACKFVWGGGGIHNRQQFLFAAHLFSLSVIVFTSNFWFCSFTAFE